MKKKTVKILMGVALISTLLGACSTNRSTQNEQKTLNTEISKIVKNHSESTYEENTKENTEKVVEKNTEDNLYLTTDYKVEDYCNGYFIVSKMDGRLFGVINSKGKEVIPLKYDEVSFYNRQEVEQQGADTLLFQASYQDEDYLLDTEGKEFDSEMEIKPLLGKIDSSIKYYSRPLNMKYVDKEYTNGDVEYASGNGEINFYDKNKSKVGTFSTGYPIIEYYQLTKDYYLIDSYEGINDYHVYLNNKDNTTIWDGYAISHSLRVNIIDNNVLISVNTPGDEKIYCLASDGSISEVTGYYTDYTGIHKGQSENRPRYTIGKDDNIKIKSYDDTWLLEGDDIEICNDRYFALDPISSEGSVCRYFFLKNSDSKVVLLDADANIIDTNDLFTWGNDFEPSLKGSCISDDMYAGIIQSDTFSTYINKRNVVFGDAKNITPENLYELSQYCYAYLKSCYITRDAAVGSLTEKTKKNNPTYESTQKMVNQEIAEYLIKLKNADKTNKYGCYGFLPENNEQYLGEYDDSSIIDAVQNKSDLKDFVGIWVLDSVATNKNNDRSLSFMYGSGLTQYGADLEIDENGDFSFYIGIGLGGKGVCSIEDDHLNYNINMYEENQNVQDTMLIGKDKKYLVMKDINDNSYNLYWIRKGSQSVYSEVEEENVGKDEIELSGYIGENISQIDQNIKFTIENEVDAGKFKQNDNVCFACHKDDSIREIDITGNGGYMLYGIKYNMDVDSVRTILSKSDIWTIQNDQTDTIFCKDKSNTYYFDIYLENGSVKSLSLHSADSYCGYNHAE